MEQGIKSKAQKQKTPKKITPSYLRNYTIFYLERFSTTAANLKTVLMRRVRKSLAYHGEPSFDDAQDMVDGCVAQFVEQGLVNDVAYAETKSIALRRGGNSARQISGKLAQKGVSSHIIDQALSDANDYLGYDNNGVAELEAAKIYARKKRLGAYYPDFSLDDKELYQKHMGRLARAGFSFDIVKKVLDNDE